MDSVCTLRLFSQACFEMLSSEPITFLQMFATLMILSMQARLSEPADEEASKKGV